MDHDNLRLLSDQAGDEYQERLGLFLEFSEGSEEEVPDPYYGGPDGFENVLDLIEEASSDLAAQLRARG